MSVTPPSRRDRTAARAAAPAALFRRPGRRGQALVEFAAVLLPLLLVLVATVQFGLLFGTSVTLTNAAREGARAATIFVVDNGTTRANNDLDRCTDALDAARQAFGLMNDGAPNFSASTPCGAGTASDLNGDGFHDRWTNGDLVVSICRSAAAPDALCPDSADTASYCTRTDASGCVVRVQLTYRNDIIVPFIGQILSTDANGRFVQRAVATMVIN